MKAVFLDRDGVLNKTIFRDGKPRAPYRLEDFELFSGVVEGINLLRKAGYILIVVTNQPDVARGWVSFDAVEAVNRRLGELIEVEAVKVCYHTNDDRCACRKPAPGMILEGAKEWGIDLGSSFMIGDRYSDIEAGIGAGCKTILIGLGDTKTCEPDYRFSSLFEAACFIVRA